MTERFPFTFHLFSWGATKWSHVKTTPCSCLLNAMYLAYHLPSFGYHMGQIRRTDTDKLVFLETADHRFAYEMVPREEQVGYKHGGNPVLYLPGEFGTAI